MEFPDEGVVVEVRVGKSMNIYGYDISRVFLDVAIFLLSFSASASGIAMGVYLHHRRNRL
eukprot:Pgem_evm1s19026